MNDLYRENPESVITRAHFAKYLVEHRMVKDRETVFAKYLETDLLLCATRKNRSV